MILRRGALPAGRRRVQGTGPNGGLRAASKKCMAHLERGSFGAHVKSAWLVWSVFGAWLVWRIRAASKNCMARWEGLVWSVARLEWSANGPSAGPNARLAISGIGARTLAQLAPRLAN